MVKGMEPVPWNQEFCVEEGRYKAFRIGDLCIVVAKRGSEWHFSCSHLQVMPFPPEGEKDSLRDSELDWQRWEASEEDNVCLIRPALPPLSVISRPSSPVTLPPGSKARFFMGVPAYVELVAQCNRELMSLYTEPMSHLSYTWKGIPKGNEESTTEGEVCVSLKTKARRVFDDEAFDPGSIICTVEISNHCNRPLPFSRLRLDTNHLGLYLTSTRIWANYCRYDIYDGEFKDGILYANGPPREAGESVMIVPPRVAGSPQSHRKSGAIDLIVDKFKLNI